RFSRDWSSDVCSSDLRPLHVFRQTQPGELPALLRVEEITIGRAGMATRGGTACALEHPLPGHELAVIFPHRARCRLEAGIGQIRSEERRVGKECTCRE